MFSGEDPYMSSLAQMLSQNSQQGMLQPSIMPVNIRPFQVMDPGPAGPSEEEIKDAERNQLISSIGSAVGGIVGAYGQANQTGAYAPGGALGAQPSGAASGGQMTTAQSNQLKQQGVVPRGPTQVVYDPNTKRTQPAPPQFGQGSESVDAALKNRGFLGGNPSNVTQTSPTGESAVQHPAIQSIAAQVNGGGPNPRVSFETRPIDEGASRALFGQRGRGDTGGLSNSDLAELYGGAGRRDNFPPALNTGPVDPVLTGGSAYFDDGGLRPLSHLYSVPDTLYYGSR